jgi:hypothetical protein
LVAFAFGDPLLASFRTGFFFSSTSNNSNKINSSVTVPFFSLRQKASLLGSLCTLNF